MDGRIASRLSQLRHEFETGKVRLGQLEVEQDYLRERLLMLKGAIAALEDLLTGELVGGHSPGTADDGRLAHAGAVGTGACAAEFLAAPATPDGADRSRE